MLFRSFLLQAGAADKFTGGGANHLSTSDAGATALKYSVTANGEGKITSEDIAKAIEKSINENGGKIYIQSGIYKADGTANTAADVKYIEYSVTRDGDKLKFEMTDKGYDDACAAANKDATATTPTGANYFAGNLNIGLVGNANAATDTGNLGKFYAANNLAVVGNAATCEVNEGTTPADTIYAQAYIRFDPANGASANGVNKTTDYIADGKGFKIGDEYYVFAGSDATYNTEYADNVKVVDIRDLTNLTDGKATSANAADKAAFKDDLRKALDRLSVAAKDNEMFDVQVEERGTMIVVNERTTYTGGANLTEKD